MSFQQTSDLVEIGAADATDSISIMPKEESNTKDNSSLCCTRAGPGCLLPPITQVHCMKDFFFNHMNYWLICSQSNWIVQGHFTLIPSHELYTAIFTNRENGWISEVCVLSAFFWFIVSFSPFFSPWRCH